MNDLQGAVECVSLLIIFFQWRSHQFLKWKAAHSRNGFDDLRDQIEKITLQMKDFDDYKKRVDSLTLKAGFKL